MFKTGGDNRIVISVSIMVTFLLSYVLVVLYKKICCVIDEWFDISDKMCKLVKL